MFDAVGDDAADAFAFLVGQVLAGEEGAEEHVDGGLPLADHDDVEEVENDGETDEEEDDEVEVGTPQDGEGGLEDQEDPDVVGNPEVRDVQSDGEEDDGDDEEPVEGLGEEEEFDVDDLVSPRR